MDDFADFAERNENMIEQMAADTAFSQVSTEWLERSFAYEYSYHFEWLGMPIIQYPQDMLAMQEIIWKIRPDLIIETGVARGGSLVYYASLLDIIGEGHVLGIDIDIRDHNRKRIEMHQMFERITLIEGSSVDEKVVQKVQDIAAKSSRVLVCLDSNHTHEHVLQELELYSPFVTVGSYCVVSDTIVDNLPAHYFSNRPWGPDSNPKTAVKEFLKRTKEFQIDKRIQNKLSITVAPDGYLKRIL